MHFNPMLVAPEFLFPKSFANASHYDHTLRLKNNYDTVDLAENRFYVRNILARKEKMGRGGL